MQCALIAERCLGPNCLLFAEINYKLGRKFISYKSFSQGEKLLELSINTSLSLDRYFELGDFMPGNFMLDVKIMVENNHIPKFTCYIGYLLHYLEDLSAGDTSIYEWIEEMVQLFMLWSIYDANSEFLSLLQTFIEKCHHACQGSTLLHEILPDLEHFNVDLLSDDVVMTFIEAFLVAGGNKVIDCVDDNGQRPLHLCINNKCVAKLLIKHGAHADAVNKKGETAFPRGTFGVPSLYCTAANATVKHLLPYQSVGLPSCVVQFIGLHDPKMF